MSVDDELLNQAKQGEENSDPIDRVADYNSQQQKARIEKKEKEAEEKKKKSLVPKKLNPMQRTLAGFTRSAWTYLFIFFFLPIIWIDIHWLGGYLGYKKMFVPLGGEWFARPGVNESKMKRLAMSLNMPESVGCACVNFGCLIILIFTIALVAFLFCAANPALCSMIFIMEWVSDVFDKIKSFFVSN